MDTEIEELKMTHREMIKWAMGILVLLVGAWPMNTNAQQRVTGQVYVDLNNNHKKETREQGLPHVKVSNGVQVTETDAKGRYDLPVGEDNIIFVIKPVGYRVPVDSNNIPKFYYIHKPKGSPGYLQYKGVAPTGPLPKSVDFALIPQPEPDTLRMLVLADPQPRGDDELYYLDKGIISELRQSNKGFFGITLGDNISDNLDLNKPYIQLIRKIGIPVYQVLGNHDANKDAKADSVSDETFESYYGPANYSLNVGQVHLILLDDILFPDIKGGKIEGAGFREDQFQFIRNDLQWVSKDQLVILAFHVPLNNTKAVRIEDRQRIFDLLKDFPHRMILSGHTHVQRQILYTEKDGWKGQGPLYESNVGTASGDWNAGRENVYGIPDATMKDGTPRGYAYATFVGNQMTLDFKALGRPDTQRMEIYMPKVLPDHIPHGRFNSARVYVNFYMGSEKDPVAYRIDGGSWQPLKHLEDYDPHYLSLLQEWDQSDTLMMGRRPSNAGISTHLWAATLPTEQQVGEHLLEVKVKDLFGRWFFEKRSFQVKPYRDIPYRKH